MTSGRGRKKQRTIEPPSAGDTAHSGVEGRLNHQSFDIIKNIKIDRDSTILQEFGVPLPVPLLSVDVVPNQSQFALIVQVFSRYTEHLLDSIERCKDQKFAKRRTMFIKLVNAMNLKFICAFRWKYYDRLLLKSIDRNKFGLSNNIQKVKEYLQIYQSLWQEHCRSMQRLLGEWNDVNYLMNNYKIDKPEETEISNAIEEINKLVEATTISTKDSGKVHEVDVATNDGNTDTADKGAQSTDHQAIATCNTSTDLLDLLNNVPCDGEYVKSIDKMKNKINHLKYTRTNQLQQIVNRTIGKYEELLDKLEAYNDTLVKVSSNISEKMFKKMPINQYVKLIQVCIS
ncbi:hypothetical protein MACK_000031 [Theileria orientalis]|uniref:Uncharacterized protein n=1 Tax=Theileria orientalis TaxID=68886 RepID=A0A976M8V5_THEOR|nr:hypothetical protein MACK_000031 [Theileria orientalis]